MNVGEKIRQLRLSKMMTQADLAGEHITRNMLCCIERGTALPSLPTACYLAGRLGVPVGYLLSDTAEEGAYRKMMAMPNVKRALAEGDDAGCLAVIAGIGPFADDELSLLRAECEFRLARAAFAEGRLRLAAAGFDRALTAAGETAYTTAWMRSAAGVYFRYLATLSPTFASDVLDEDEVESARYEGDDFTAYYMAIEAFGGGRTGEVEHYLARTGDTLYAARVRALCLMKQGAGEEALTTLTTLLDRPDLGVGVLLYELFGDLDACCRQNDDYKKAYEYATARRGLLERLLEEA